MAHVSVLTEENVNGLAIKSGFTVVDCTLGAGGYARAILPYIGSTGTYIGLDVDETAIAVNQDLLDSEATVHLVHRNFSALEEVLAELGVQKVDAIVADLGWRSEQFEEAKKGFSFAAEDPLLMTYGQPGEYTFTAHDIVNEWEEESLADIIYGYGEERAARKIASAIVTARKTKEIATATELAEIITTVKPSRGKIHPATKTFQALRIAVNDELGVLKALLPAAFASLKSEGRLGIVSFHSLEDRIVKIFFKEQAYDHTATILTKKPIVASATEIAQNPRARSAKLRIIEKT